jgi:hypothetical protein
MKASPKMRFAPPSRLAYRCCGGEILSRGRPISDAGAAAALDALARMEDEAHAKGDDPARRWCAALALELSSALDDQSRWRRAADPAPVGYSNTTLGK